jgi:hypothetical protein
MDESESTQDQYASFLVRLWRSADPAPGSSNGDWQGEVEHIQSGKRLAFGSISELWEFLRQPLVSDRTCANEFC